MNADQIVSFVNPPGRGGESLAKQLGHRVCALLHGASLGILAHPWVWWEKEAPDKGKGVCGQVV